jgi:hypothetical protein
VVAWPLLFDDDPEELVVDFTSIQHPQKSTDDQWIMNRDYASDSMIIYAVVMHTTITESLSMMI